MTEDEKRKLRKRSVIFPFYTIKDGSDSLTILRAWKVPPRPWAPKLLSSLDWEVAFGAPNLPKPKERMLREQVRPSGVLER